MPIRFLRDHQISPADDELQVMVDDEQPHVYHVHGPDASGLKMNITFQNQPPAQGITGLTNEVLASIMIDRLKQFQQGAFACKENAQALTHFEEGLHWLQQRTISRIRRGVEGTHEV